MALTLFLFSLSLFLLLLHARISYPLIGKCAHPLGFVLLYQVFVLTLPGLLIVAFASECFGSVTCSITLDEIKNRVVRDYSIVLATFLATYILFNMRRGADYSQTNLYDPCAIASDRFLYTCWALTFLILLFRLLTTKDIPLVLALKGDVVGAELAKAAILRGEQGLKLPLLNFFLKYFPLYTFYVALINYLKGRIGVWRFIVSVALVLLVLTYDLQKTHFVTAVLASFWLFVSLTGRYRVVVVGFFVVFVLIAALFNISFDFDGDFGFLLDAILNRLLIAQAEGMFWVYQYLEPASKYTFWGMPFASSLGVPQSDPLSDVISVVFPGAPEGWVNSTTFITGEAYAIFGHFGVVVACIVVVVNVALLGVISRKLLKADRELFFPAVFLMTYTLPLANNVTDLLYGRFLFGFVAFMFFPLLAKYITRFRVQLSRN